MSSVAITTETDKPVDATPPEPLTPAEQSSLEECEGIIERGRKAFVEVGRALTKIRDGQLWRASHDSFETYCKDRWDFGRAYASRLIGASETMEVLLPIGNTPPATESQTRPLLQFPVEDRPQVWQDVLERVGHDDGEKITARDVEREVDLLLCLAEGDVYKRRKRAKRKEIRDKQRKAAARDRRFAEELADQDAGPDADDDLLGATCPNCGNQDVDEDGDCAQCHEPDVVPISAGKPEDAEVGGPGDAAEGGLADAAEGGLADAAEGGLADAAEDDKNVGDDNADDAEKRCMAIATQREKLMHDALGHAAEFVARSFAWRECPDILELMFNEPPYCGDSSEIAETIGFLINLAKWFNELARGCKEYADAHGIEITTGTDTAYHLGKSYN